MCFITKSPQIHVAESDITVYKILNEDNSPQFLVDRIAEPTHQYGRKGDRLDDPSLVQQYSPGQLYEDSGATLAADHPVTVGQYKVERGFHSYKQKPHIPAIFGDKDKVVMFTIPAGAKYRLGYDYGGKVNYISDKIRAGSLVHIQS